MSASITACDAHLAGHNPDESMLRSEYSSHRVSMRGSESGACCVSYSGSYSNLSYFSLSYSRVSMRGSESGACCGAKRIAVLLLCDYHVIAM